MKTRTLLALALTGLASTATAAAQGALPAPPEPPQNPTTAEKAVLGKILFWDEQLSSDGSIACGTCHIPGTGGSDPRIGSPLHPGPDGVFNTADDIFGSQGVTRGDVDGNIIPDATFGFSHQATNRFTPSMIAAAYFPELFWDGRADGTFRDPLTNNVIIPVGGALESQSLGPILSDVEMADEGRGWDEVVSRLEGAKPLALATNLPADTDFAIFVHQDYPGLFESAFGTPEITPVRIAFALAAYQRTLVPDESKFDRVMRGQAQFTQAENRGRGAFNNPGSRCNQCHSGSLFSDGEYHNLGLRPIAEDDGRRSVTGNNQDRGRFKTPSLRNVALRERFMHTGAPDLDTLLDVMNFYNQDGGPFNDNKDPLLNGLGIPPQARPDLVAFLNTLTDPRVANETFPFDRPTLWSERTQPNPRRLGTGAVAGSFGITPQVLIPAPAHSGNEGFRIGVTAGLGGAWGMLRTRFQGVPAGSMTQVLHPGPSAPQILSGTGPGSGFTTYADTRAVSPALVGFTYDAQWLIRDPGAPQGVAKSDIVRITVE